MPPRTPVEGAIPTIQETRRTYLRPYLFVKVYFNIIPYTTLYSTERSSEQRDTCENNSRQDREGEKKTTPTSQLNAFACLRGEDPSMGTLVLPGIIQAIRADL
jgi:hypothetical protein